MIDFRFHVENDTHVVWLAGINRYIQLKEPAFRVFELWAKGGEKSDIAGSCSARYFLPEVESMRFVEEIISEVQSLFEYNHHPAGIKCEENNTPLNPEYFSEHTYKIGNHFFRFCYRNEYLKELFHPLFLHHETESGTACDSRFELFNAGVQDGFRVNNSAPHFFPVSEIDGFQGAVFMEMLNVIHDKKSEDWMGVIHASAVTDGSSAVVFAAPSGSGKTSIALLMMAAGFNLLSDDFVPVAIHKPEIYHFPAGVSVKRGSVKFLQEHLPHFFARVRAGGTESEIFIPPAAKSVLLTNVPAKAIVFVNYNPSTKYELKKESNLQAMNQLVKQSWIAGTPEAAERFLDWYFRLPVYSLTYSDNEKAVHGMRELFGMSKGGVGENEK